MRTIRFLAPSAPLDHMDSTLCKALEKFWSKVDEESFQSSDWKVRFHSGETVLQVVLALSSVSLSVLVSE